MFKAIAAFFRMFEHLFIAGENLAIATERISEVAVVKAEHFKEVSLVEARKELEAL